jgi:porin
MATIVTFLTSVSRAPAGLGIIIALLGGVLLGGLGTAAAQPYTVPDTWGGDFWSRPRVTGDWGGLRDAMGKKGVVLDLDLLLTPQAVLSGGHDTGSSFWGNAEYTLNVDTGKAGLWPGGFLKLSANTSFGGSVIEDSGSLVPVNIATLVPKPNDPSTGLMNATFMQFLSTKFGLVVGKIDTLDAAAGEFAGNYRTQFLNTGLVLPMSLALVPISAYGGGLIVLPWPNVVLSALALDPSGTPTENDVSKAFDDGVMLLVSGQVTITPFGRRGTQRLGVMWSNKDHVSLSQDPSNVGHFLATASFPRLGDPGRLLTRFLERFFPQLLVPVQPANKESSTWAMFYGFDQYLWHPGGDKTRGIGLFFNFGASDGEANPVKYSYSMGIGGKGVMPGRPNDTFGLGWSLTKLSDDFLPELREALGLGLERESAVELYYNAALTPWLSATASFQLVQPALTKKLTSSGGLQDVDPTVVAGLRLYMRF